MLFIFFDRCIFVSICRKLITETYCMNKNNTFFRLWDDKIWIINDCSFIEVVHWKKYGFIELLQCSISQKEQSVSVYSSLKSYCPIEQMNRNVFENKALWKYSTISKLYVGRVNRLGTFWSKTGRNLWRIFRSNFVSACN